MSKFILDSNQILRIININRTHHASEFHAQPGGIFLSEEDFMHQYPKQILMIKQQIQSYLDGGMEISSRSEVELALKTIGYYRLL